MALNINGTTGISGVDGSASAPALQGTDSNTGINFASDTVNINTGGVTRATVDSSGNLIVPGDIGLDGQTSPTSSIHIRNKSTDGYELKLSGNALTLNRDGAAYIQQEGTGDLVFRMGSSNTERARLTSAGRVGLGKSDPDYHLDISDNTAQVGIRVRQQTNNTANTYSNMILRHAAATTGQNAYGILFQNSGGSEVGKIDYGQSTTQYRTSSDYRLKENAVAISDGITRLKTLKPYQFNWIAEPDQPKVDGFFAHEVTAVPEAISGTKDEVDSDNNPVYQAIDHSKLVPLLTAALQEAVAKIEVLETKVAALEAG